MNESDYEVILWNYIHIVKAKHSENLKLTLGFKVRKRFVFLTAKVAFLTAKLVRNVVNSL